MNPPSPEPESSAEPASPPGESPGDDSAAEKHRAADEIFAGWMTKRAPAERSSQAQDAATLEALCSRHPDHADELRELHAQWRRVNSILDRLGGQPSVSQRLRTRFGQSVDPGISLHGDDADGAAGAATSRLLERLSSNRAPSSRYRMRGELGRGGMGIVYDVWDEDLRRTLAMKVVLGKRDPSGETTKVQVDPRRMSRFLEEAQITGQLDHPSILPIHELGLDKDGRVYFTMQRVEGRELREVFGLAREGKEGWSQARVLDVLIKVCEATAFAHSKGVIHRDLKPANVMVGKFGATYLMDWGLAKVIGREESRDLRLRPADGGIGAEAVPQVATDRSSSDSVDDALATMDGDIVGTPAYMPPEQANAQVDRIGPHSDVYSAGAMLYHLLTGQMPYEPLGERVPAHTILNAVRTSEPWPIEDITPNAPPELVAICKKAMAREIGDRYRDMTELAEELRNYRDGRPVAAYDTGLAEEVRKWVQRNKPLAAMAAALAVVLIGSVVAFVAQQRTQLGKLAAEQLATQSAREEAEKNFREAEAQAQIAEDERSKAEIAAEDARRESNNALINSQVALEKAEEAERKGYLAHLVAADFSLQLGNTEEALIHLADCPPERRQFEWQHLWAKTNTYITEARGAQPGSGAPGNGGPETFLAALPGDGSSLITIEASRATSNNDAIRFFDAETGEKERLMRIASLPIGVMGEGLGRSRSSLGVVSRDGSLLVAALRGGAPRLWNLAARTKPKTFEDHEIVFLGTGDGTGARKGSQEEAVDTSTASLALSPDGTTVAAGLADGSVFLWKRDSAVPFLRIDPAPSQKAASALTFSPDGQSMVIGYATGLCRMLFIPDGGVEVLELRGGDSRVNDLAWSPDGAEIASVSRAGTLRLWNAASGEPLWILREHRSSVNSVAHHPDPDRKLLATASSDGTIRLWDRVTGRVLNVIGAHRGEVLHVEFDREGERLVSGSSRGTSRVWDLEDLSGSTILEANPEPETPANLIEEEMVNVEFSPDGSAILTLEVLTDSSDIQSFTGKPKQVGNRLVVRENADESIRFVSRSPADPWIAATWCGVEGQWIAALEAGGGKRLEREGGAIVEGGVVLLDGQTGQYVKHLNSDHSRLVNLVAGSPDGRWVATAGADRNVHLIELASGEVVHRLGDHGGAVYALAFSPDGEWLATSGRNRAIYLWRVADGSLHSSIDTGLKWRVRALAFDPESRWVAGVHSKDVHVWDIEDGSSVFQDPLIGHEKFVTAVLFHPDEDRVITTSLDGTVKIWDLAAGEELLAIEVGTDLSCGAIHPKGSRLAVGKSLGGAMIFETETAAERRAARRALPLGSEDGR